MSKSKAKDSASVHDPSATITDGSMPLGDELSVRVAEFIDTQVGDSPSESEAVRHGNEISTIVRGFGMDAQMIAGAHLFPCVKSGAISHEQVKKHFGEELARLIRQIIKLSDFGFPPNWEPGSALGGRQIDALRKMLLAVAEDVRLVLVRLADQLYRLRKAKSASDKKKRQVALETREIFAPLASRLGVWQIKWELEDLSFRFLQPDDYMKIAGWLRERRTDREAYIERVISDLKTIMASVNIVGDVQGRPKHIYSIWRKMQRKGVDFEHVFDMRAVRVLLDSVADCYTVLGLVHGSWSYIPGEFDDYIATPKDNNYQSLHTAVMGPENKTIEIQIRTKDMHAHAELGVAAHWSYKEGTAADPSYHQKINWLRSILEPGDEEQPDSDDDFIERFKSEIFEDRVYAMTPGGDVVDLPYGATPLDFAYYVHTNLGHCCRGAKINGRIVPLTHKLQNGDIVDIIRAKIAKPSRDWLIPQLGYLASNRARAKARVWFRRQDQEHSVEQGKVALEKELRRLGVEKNTAQKHKPADAPKIERSGTDVPHATELAKEFRLGSATELYAGIGTGDITMSDVARVVQRITTPQIPETVAPTVKKPAKTSGGDDIQIEGVGDLLTNMARCCKPVPPDNITGYITQGRGVTIHRQDCGNVLHLQTTHPERILEVAWTENRPDKYPVDVVIEAYDREGLLKDISSLLSLERVGILSINTRKDAASMVVKLDVTLAITGLEELSRILHKLNSLPNIFSVSRN